MQTHSSLGRFSMLFFFGGTWQITRNRTRAEWWWRIPIAGLISRVSMFHLGLWAGWSDEAIHVSGFWMNQGRMNLRDLGPKYLIVGLVQENAPQEWSSILGVVKHCISKHVKKKHISLSAMYFQMPLGKRLAGSVMKASHMLVYLSVEPPSISLHFWVVRVVNRIQGHFGQLAFSDEMVWGNAFNWQYFCAPSAVK